MGIYLKDLMKTADTAKVREALGDYLKALKMEFTMGMILPTKAMATQELTVKRKLSENTLQIQASSPVALGVGIPTAALYMMELFDTAIEQLYRIFTVKDLVQNFSKSPAVLEAEKGGKLQMFDRNITGKYIELLTHKKIIMGASLVAQWLRICLPMQGTRVRALVWEDPTCRGATKPVCHNY